MYAIASAFGPALPVAVREIVEQARVGGGPARIWLAGDPGVSHVECARMLNEPRVPAEIVGWLVGMTMFVERNQQLAASLGRASFRDDVIPFVLDAVGAGIVVARLEATARLWTSIEMLVGRIAPANVPQRLFEALAVGLSAAQAGVRGCALRLAGELGAPARAAIEAAVSQQANEPSSSRSGSWRANRGRSGRALADALVTLAGGEPPPSTEDAELLLRCLDAWRETRDPQLEKPIIRLGADLARARGAIDARSRGELDGAWHAVAKLKDPIDLTRLLDAPWPSSWKRAKDRVTALAEFPADPRIAFRLAEVARGHDTIASLPLHHAIASVIATSATPTILPGLDAIEATRPSHLRSTYAFARSKAASPREVRADPQLVAVARAGDRPDIDALFAQHAANPGDLDARAVLADALQLAGDPRGELITLQLAIADGTASAGAERRATALLAQHAEAWMGPLPAIDRSSRRFERGFLVAVTSRADNAAIARSLDRPEWTTIEELTIEAPDVELAPLVARMPLLRRLCAHAGALGKMIAPGPRRGIQTVFSRGGWMPQAGVLPDLAVLGGDWLQTVVDPELAAFHALQRFAVARGVRAMVYLGFPGSSLVGAVSIPGAPETRFALERRTTEFDPPGWRVRVRRDDPVIDVAWAYHRYADEKTDEVFSPLAAAGVCNVALWFPDGLRHERDRLIKNRPFDIAITPGAAIDLSALTTS